MLHSLGTLMTWGRGGERLPRSRRTSRPCRSGDRVLEVLRAKYTEARPPTAASLTPYTGCPPELTPVDITEDTVTSVVGQLSGGAEPGGTDSVSLQNLLLRFGAASAELRLIVGDFIE